MTYEFRHDFMANAVDEYLVMFGYRDKQPNAISRDISYACMKLEFTQAERNDWFAMYAMGCVPFPGQGRNA